MFFLRERKRDMKKILCAMLIALFAMQGNVAKGAKKKGWKEDTLSKLISSLDYQAISDSNVKNQVTQILKKNPGLLKNALELVPKKNQDRKPNIIKYFLDLLTSMDDSEAIKKVAKEEASRLKTLQTENSSDTDLKSKIDAFLKKFVDGYKTDENLKAEADKKAAETAKLKAEILKLSGSIKELQQKLNTLTAKLNTLKEKVNA